MRSDLLLAVVLLGLGPLAGAAPAPAGWQPTRLLPVDEAGEDPSFLAFRDTFRQAIRDRDAAGILVGVDPEVQLDFGGGHGLALFTARWRPEDPSGPLWSELEAILGHGGSFVDDRGARLFCAPYVFTTFPPLDSYDGFGAILGADVALRDSPSEGSQVLRRLSHDIVRAPYRFVPANVTPPEVAEGWVLVETTDGLRGFVRDQSEFRSPIDRRACFKKTDAGWRLSSFVGGD